MIKSFSKFLATNAPMSNKTQVNETSMSRVWRDANDPKIHIGVISSHRADRSARDNAVANANLKADLVKHGLRGWVQVTGHYIENKGTPQERNVKERSFYVKHADDKHLHSTLTKLGAKYNQDSVLIKRGGDKEAKLVGTKKDAWPGEGKEESVGKFHPSAGDSPFFSTIRNKKGHDYSFREEFDSIVLTTERTFLNRGNPDHDGPEYI